MCVVKDDRISKQDRHYVPSSDLTQICEIRKTNSDTEYSGAEDEHESPIATMRAVVCNRERV